MRKLLLILLAVTGMLVSACYKDKGNYEYNVPEQPLITNIDSVYSVNIGDSLNVRPVVSFSDKGRLSYEWRIGVPEEFGERLYTGSELNIIFGLSPKEYHVRMTVYDSLNGMKYFYNFIISGKTALSSGTTVLSEDGGTAKLSFIKPDGSVVPDLFYAVNNRHLPGGPLQIVALRQHNYVNEPLLGYWITATQESEGGLLVDPDTFKEIRTLKDNFFTPPSTVKTGFMRGSQNGVLEGVINGKLYVGASQTYYLAPIYGYFGVAAEGDYEAYGKCLANPSFPFYMGYDINRKQFIGFTNFGGPAYVGTSYQVVGTEGFNPLDVGLDMLNIEQVNAIDGYALGKGTDGIIYELKYNMGFIGIIQITPVYKRPFSRQELIKANTKWQVTPAQIFYFTSGDKVYRYNPLNEEIKALTTDFGGKDVTMIKVTDNGNTLIAGVKGTIYYLDINVGKSGEVLKKIEGIPGQPVDITSR